MKALHMTNDLSDDATQSIADGQNAGAVELRGLHMQQIVDATIGHLPSENIEGREVGGLFDPESALHEQLKQRPVPEAVGLLRPGCG